MNPIVNSSIVDGSRVGSIYAYAIGGIASNANTAVNGLVYQWYNGVAGDTSTPLIGNTSNILDTRVVIDGGIYWVRVTDGALNQCR